MEATKETKFGTKVAYGMRMRPECQIHTKLREGTRYHTRRWKRVATWHSF